MTQVFGFSANLNFGSSGGTHDHTCFMATSCEQQSYTDCMLYKGTSPARIPQWGADGCLVPGDAIYWVR